MIDAVTACGAYYYDTQAIKKSYKINRLPLYLRDTIYYQTYFETNQFCQQRDMRLSITESRQLIDSHLVDRLKSGKVY